MWIFKAQTGYYSAARKVTFPKSVRKNNTVPSAVLIMNLVEHTTYWVAENLEPLGGRSQKAKMIWFFQVNLGRGKLAQDLLTQICVETSIDFLLVSEQYKKLRGEGGFEGVTARSAIEIQHNSINITEANEITTNFVWVNIQVIRVYRYYFWSPNYGRLELQGAGVGFQKTWY